MRTVVAGVAVAALILLGSSANADFGVIEGTEHAWKGEAPDSAFEACILQIIQFIDEHPDLPKDEFPEFQCADLVIGPDAEQPKDARW